MRLAATMHTLMTDVLGYDRYLTYGEDVSANVNDLIAATYPDQVAGILVTHSHFPSRAERALLTDPAERAFFDDLDAAHGPNGAYGHVQGTRPDTLAAALNDSPAGLLAWLAEKLVEWSDTPPGDPAAVERRISRDRILTEAMIYWVTESIGTSFRPYYEGADQPDSDAARRGAGGGVHPASRRCVPRVASLAATTATSGCSSDWPKAGTSQRPRSPRGSRSAPARSRVTSACCDGLRPQSARPRRLSSGSISASRPRKSRKASSGSFDPPTPSRRCRKRSPFSRVSPPLSPNQSTVSASSTSLQMYE